VHNVGGADLEAVTTKRLHLRAASVDDAESLFPIFADPTGWWYEPGGVHRNVTRTRSWLATAATRWADDGLSYWVVCSAGSGEVIGVGGVQRRPSRSWNLFYRIATAHWGKGYATEVAQAAIAAAQGADDQVSVGAWIAAHNHPSRRVAERVGLVDYGLYLDVVDRQTRVVYADRPPIEGGDAQPGRFET
jgi:RimJ/RimL family protein N-acetyltransferase